MAVATTVVEEGTRIDWARKYPPLLTIAIAGAIALVVLPSALNLPQSNPTETLEYAPVPPDDESNDNPPGNLASVGLGTSAGIGSSNAKGRGVGEEEPTTTTRPPASRGARKRTVVPRAPKSATPIEPGVNCVGSPPRQTFDPLAPPCVPFFEGDNGCDTYSLGVTCDEVKLLFYLDGGITYVNASDTANALSPGATLWDLHKSPEANQVANNRDAGRAEHLVVRSMRVWQEYFNERFQTYGRKAHFYVYFSNARTPETRRADAAKMMTDVAPFAVVSAATEGNEDAFLNEMARKGVLNFGAFAVREKEFFDRFPRMIWSYLPSAEQQINTFGTYLCRQVVGRAPVLAGADLQQQNSLPPSAGGNGGVRKLGMLRTEDGDYKGMIRMAELVRKTVQAPGCGGLPDGGRIVDEATFNPCCLAQDPSGTGDGQQQMARFKSQGITTIIWPGGISGNFVKAASAINYHPEWIVLGDSILDAKYPNRLAGSTQGFDGRAILITPQPFQPELEQQQCYRAYRELDHTTPNQDLQYTCNYYRDVFQFFVAVHVAGPYLNPTSIDKGFHAIPQRYNGSPDVPACFYLAGDYTCVKDAAAYIWDASQRAPGDDQPGCWAGIEGAIRFAPDAWHQENINARLTGTEACTGYDSRVRYNAT